MRDRAQVTGEGLRVAGYRMDEGLSEFCQSTKPHTRNPKHPTPASVFAEATTRQERPS